jgi:15-cis-phytoene synthase
MFTQSDIIDPAKRLALTYAKDDSRAVLTTLLMFDLRVSQIMSKVSEPLIGQMRMAWWRDALMKPAQDRPKGEPLFQELASLQHNIAPPLIHLVDAWSALLAAEEWNNDVLAQYAYNRSQGIFGGFAGVLGIPDDMRTKLINIGERWALVDLLSFAKTSQQADAINACLPKAPDHRVPRAVRALSMLALSAEQGGGGMAPGLRMIWHGLTGR